MRYSLISERVPFYTPIEQIFFNRKIPINEIEHYKNVNSSDAHSPALLFNIREGVRLLVKHIKEKSKIGVLVDCDADGFTSAALLINYLSVLFPASVGSQIIYYFHEDKKHGLKDSLEKIIKSGVQLVIVPDAGGGDGKYAAILKENNIDTLIIDHHHTNIEDCYPAVVINNQLGEYPNKTLSGVGVVYQFCKYLDEILLIDNANYYLDLVAVGCVADLMPLIEYETLYYIRTGLSKLNNPFIKAMVKEQEYSINKHGGLDPYAVGFYIAPFINATIRVGTLEEKELLFKAMLENFGNTLVKTNKRGHKGEEVILAEEACRISSNVKARQTKMRDENLEIIENLIQERELDKNKVIAVTLDKKLDINKNILGLIANILMEKYKKPILLLNDAEETIEEKNVPVWAGSVRNNRYSDIQDLREFLENMPQVLYAQGHASAFGVAIYKDRLEEFIEEINFKLKDMDFSPSYKVDIIFSSNEKNPNFILEINELLPYYGQGFEEPYVAVENINIDKENTQLLSPDKNPTLKITLPSGVELIKFKSSMEEYNNLLNTTINIVGKCAANQWLGKITPQIKIEDYNVLGYSF